MHNTKKVYYLKVTPATLADRNEQYTPLKMVYRTICGRSYSTAFKELIEKYCFQN